MGFGMKDVLMIGMIKLLEAVGMVLVALAIVLIAILPFTL